MSTDSSKQGKSVEKAAGSVGEESTGAKEKSFIVMLDDDTDSSLPDGGPKRAAEVVGDDAKESTNQSVSADESPTGSFVVLLDDDDEHEDDMAATVSLNDQGECTVTFSEDISIRNIMALKTALSRTLEASSVTFDASQADIVDTSTIQLLYAHSVSLKEHKIPSTWESRSERFSAVEKRLGFNLSQ